MSPGVKCSTMALAILCWSSSVSERPAHPTDELAPYFGSQLRNQDQIPAAGRASDIGPGRTVAFR
jgi:hypothetical protein